MQEFIDSIEFENMAREYNEKYNNARVLELNKKELDDFKGSQSELKKLSSLFSFVKCQINILGTFSVQRFVTDNNNNNYKSNSYLLSSKQNFKDNNTYQSLQSFDRIQFILKKIDEMEKIINNIKS